jgi:hypothetical protein
MGLTDLTAADDLTFPDIKKLAAAYSANSSLSEIQSPASDRIAFLTVTSTWLKSTFVANGVIREDDDGIITDYPESTGIWSAGILNKNNEPHPTYPEGCGFNPAGGQVMNVGSPADYNACIDAAIRLQEAEYTIDANGNQVGEYADSESCSDSTKACFDCQTPARYGTDKSIVRFNKVLTACQLEKLMVAAGVTDNSGGPKFPLQGCSLGFPPLPEDMYPPKTTTSEAECTTSAVASTTM